MISGKRAIQSGVTEEAVRLKRCELSRPGNVRGVSKWRLAYAALIGSENGATPTTHNDRLARANEIARQPLAAIDSSRHKQTSNYGALYARLQQAKQ